MSNRANPPPTSVVITGQPGIGKTYWMLYAVRRRLGEAKPFLWCFEATWHLFVEGGVFQPLRDLHVGAFRRYLWTFVDADNGFPSKLSAAGTRMFNMVSPPPLCSRWKSLDKGTCMFLIMNPWTWEEMCWAAALSGFSKDQYADAQNVFYEYGPTARLCINYSRIPKQLSLYHADREALISSLSIDALVKCVSEGDRLNWDASHPIFLVKRVNVDDLCRWEFTLEPITVSVRRRLKLRFMKETRMEQLLAYESFEGMEYSKPIAGVLFGAMGQCQLQEEVSLDLIPMVKQRTGKKAAQWTSQPGNGSTAPDSMDQCSGSVGADAANAIIPVKFKPEGVVQYAGSKLETFQPGVFYVPESSDQVAFDSFILADGVLLIFQFTSASSYQIKEGIMNIFSQPTLASMFQGTESRFVFVIPLGETVVCPESDGATLEGFGERVSLFSAEFDPKKRT